MSDNFSLIIKNGSCYIDGKFQNIDLALTGNKIKKLEKIEQNNSKIFDAAIKLFYPVLSIHRFILESQEQIMLKT